MNATTARIMEAGQSERRSRQFVRRTYLEKLLPVSLSVLLVQLCSIANNLAVGRTVGSEGLAVMSAVNPVYFVCATVGTLLCSGGSTLAAQRMGQDRGRDADTVFTVSLLAMLALAALLSGFGLLFRGALMDALAVPAAMRAQAADYLLVYLPGMVGVMGIYVPFNYLKLVGRAGVSVLLFLLMAMVNISLDILFAGVWGMGMRGVALATVLGALSACLTGVLLLCGKGGFFRFRLRKGCLSELSALARLGSPSAMNNVCNILRVLCLNHIIGRLLGGAGLTAFSLIASVTSLSMTISNGSSMTMAPFAAVFSGEKDSASLRQLLHSALGAGFMLMLGFAALVFAFPDHVCALFGVNAPEKQAVALPALRLFALSLPLAVLNFNLIAFHANNRRTALSNALTILRAFALVVGSALLLSGLADERAVFLSFFCAEALTLLAALLFAYAYSAKRAHVTRLSLIDTRAADEGRLIAFSVPPDNQAAAASAERITDFCAENGLKPKLVMAIGLSIEEILVSLNDHVLIPAKRSKGRDDGVNVRMLIDGDDAIILRFRCAGKAFDPIRNAESSTQDNEEYLGIRLIKGLARSVSYSHTLGINNLTILL